MQITVLMENSAPAHLIAEHGLSLYLRYEGRAYLLDAGQSGKFAQNADAMGCPLEAVSAAVLSHGHYDHADGFPAFFARNTQAKVYARPSVLEKQYSPSREYIGLSAQMRVEYAGRFDLSDEPRSIAPGLWLIPDSVPHEQSLVAETAHGLVVMNSCCHAGVANIVRDLLQRFPGQRVYAVLGGFHLMGPGGVTTLALEPDQVTALARELTQELGVSKLNTGHCTGAPGFALLQTAAPQAVCPLHTGDVLTF